MKQNFTPQAIPDNIIGRGSQSGYKFILLEGFHLSEKQSVCVYAKIDLDNNQTEAWETVIIRNLRYPKTEEFGKFGWCFRKQMDAIQKKANIIASKTSPEGTNYADETQPNGKTIGKYA